MIDRNEGLSAQADSLPLAAMMKDYLRVVVREALYGLVEEEVAGLCGPSHRPDAQSPYRRAGSADSRVYLEGRREALKRPRVREHKADGGSTEVTLRSWKAAQDPAQWEEATMRAVLCGVSTRDMACLSTEEMTGRSKSAVSRLWQQKAAALVEQLQQSELSELDLLVLMV